MHEKTDLDYIAFDERMTEVAGILTTGILRKRRRDMNQMKKDNSFVDTEPDALREERLLGPVRKDSAGVRTRMGRKLEEAQRSSARSVD